MILLPAKPDTACSATKVVLFLCTGNYYRSRYAEELFNFLARQQGLPWRADSRALAIERGADNIGPMAPSVLRSLATEDIRSTTLERFPLACTVDDLGRANFIVAINEAEHRSFLTERFKGWERRVTYWHVHDIDKVHPDVGLAELKANVQSLILELVTCH